MSRNQMISRSFLYISKLSGEVTAALSGIDAPSAKEAYARIQTLEADTVAAATAEQTAVECAERLRARVAGLRRQLRLFNSACLDICEAEGVVSAEFFAVMDKGDDLGLAQRLEPEIRRVPGYGASFADAMVHLLRELSHAEAAAQQARDHRTSSMRELDSALLNLRGIVAQGRAVLATFGVTLKRKVKNKNGAPPRQPPSQSGPQPQLVPSAA
jgi:hypothetical protein